MELSVTLCANHGRTPVAEVTAGEFHGTAEHLAAGTWQLDTTRGAVLSTDNGRVLTDADFAILNAVLVHRRRAGTVNKELVYTGFFHGPGDDPGGRQVDQADRLTMRGHEAFGVLSTRVAYPDWSREPEGWSRVRATVRGQAANRAALVVDANMGQRALNAIPARHIPGLFVSSGTETTAPPPSAPVGIQFPGVAGNYDSTPDHPALQLTGPFSIIAHKIGDFTLNQNFAPIAAMWPGGWIWDLTNPTGNIRFVWNTGVTRNIQAGSVTDYDGWPLVAVTFDPDDGGVARARMWRSMDGSSWDEIATNTDADNAPPNYSGGAALTVAARQQQGFERLDADIISVELRDGVGPGGQPGGTLIASRDYTARVEDYADPQGNVWALNGDDWEWVEATAPTPAATLDETPDRVDVIFDPDDYVDDLVARICDEGGVTCNVQFDQAREGVHVRFRAPIDHSDEVTFTDQGDLVELVRGITADSASIVIASRERSDDDLPRLDQERWRLVERPDRPDEVTGWGRVERSIRSSPGEAFSEGRAILRQGLRKRWVTAIPIVDEEHEWASKIMLGDLVGVRVEGETLLLPVTQFDVQWGSSGSFVRPVLGAPSQRTARLLARRMRKLDRRITRIPRTLLEGGPVDDMAE